MIETDPGSRHRLILIVGFLGILFGSFAIFGAVQRISDGRQRITGAISEPVPIAADRKLLLEKRRQWFAVRKEMAKWGKAEKWSKAIAVAETFLKKEDYQNIRLLQAEAGFRLGVRNSGAKLIDLSGNDSTISSADKALLRNDVPTYVKEVERVLDSTDEEKATVLDANNNAWVVALTPTKLPDDLVLKAVRLSEKAVNATRAAEEADTNGQNLATYTNTLGGVYVRAGRLSDAIKTLNESERLRHDPFNAAFLSLAYHQSGNEVLAAKYRQQVRMHLNETYATRDGQSYRHELLVLWRELEQESRISPTK